MNVLVLGKNSQIGKELLAIKKPLNDEIFDITLRISFPYNYDACKSKKLFVYGTAEYQNIDNLSQYLNKIPSELTACILERPRHKKIISSLNKRLLLLSSSFIISHEFII